MNTLLTDELISEGLARDLVRHIQELRKEADFEMNDRIHLYYEGSDKIKKAFENHGTYIQTETLALEIHDAIDKDIIAKEIKLGGEVVKLGVRK